MSKRDCESSKLERVLLLYMSIKATPGKTPREIQQDLGVGKSAYGRYRDLLRRIGVDFRYDRRSRQHVIEKDAFLTAPDLTLDERLSIILAVGQLGGFQETFLAAQARKAAAKLLAVNEATIGAACSSLLGVPEMPAHVGGKEEVVDTLFQAIIERRRIRIFYCKPAAHPEEHEVDPLQMYVLEGALYLDGYNWMRGGVRCFKVCRISKVIVTDIRFSNVHGYDYARRRQNAFGVFATEREPQKVRVWFSSFAAPYIREEYRHPSQTLTSQVDGSVIFEVEVDKPSEVLWWAMRWGGDFEVLEPQWLREEAMNKVRGMMGRYGMRVVAEQK